MLPEIQSLCIAYIREEWRKLKPNPGSDDVYLEMTWGALYGRGYRMRVEKRALQVDKIVWVS